MVEEIFLLITTYLAAFASGEVEQMIDFWDFPSQISGGHEVRTYYTPAQLIMPMSGLLGFYAEIGLRITDNRIAEIRRLSETAAIVRVVVNHSLPAENITGQWENIFFARRVREEWKFVSAIIDEEAAFLKSRGFLA